MEMIPGTTLCKSRTESKNVASCSSVVTAFGCKRTTWVIIDWLLLDNCLLLTYTDSKTYGVQFEMSIRESQRCTSSKLSKRTWGAPVILSAAPAPQYARWWTHVWTW